MTSDESAAPTEQVPYPIEYYQLAAAGCVGIAGIATAYSIYLYPMNGEWATGVGMLIVGLLWLVIANLTNHLRRAHHA